jgi:phosphatidylinositol alpha-1,6-mannosyltransferase
MQFYPIVGGVETFLLEVSKAWPYHDIEIWCRKHMDVDILIHKPVKIKRFNWGKGTYYKFIKLWFSYLFKAKDPINYIIFGFLVLINRVAIHSCTDFISETVQENITYDGNFTIQCSMPLFTGVIGTFYNCIYGNKLIVYVHGRELNLYHKRLTQRLLQQFVLKNADLVITNSQYTTQLALSHGVNPTKIFKTLLGANTTLFYPKDTQSLIKKKYAIPENHKILLTVSHLVPRKGADMVIKALPKILKNIPNLTYLIGGRGDYLDTLKRLVNELNLEPHVIFLGFVKDEEMNDLFNACDIFIMPNRQEDYDVEGFGIVFADAAACAKPTIAGNSGGAVDAIADNKTGFLVDPLSVNDIAKKCITLLSDDELRKRFGQNGYKRVLSELNWDSVRKKIFEQVSNLDG